MLFLGLLSTGLRLALLIRRPLWFDETFTVWAARGSVARLLEILREDSGPPLFYLLAKPFVALAESLGDDRIVRLPSFAAAALLLVLGSLSLPAGRPRLYGALLFGSSTLLNLYAAEARAYALLSLLVFPLFLLALRKEETPRRTVAIAAIAAAALWTHYLAILAVGGLLLLVVLRRRWRSALGLTAGTLAFLPWVAVLLRQPEGSLAWMHETPAGAIGAFLSTLGGVGRIPAPFGYAPAALMWAAAAVGLILLALLAGGARSDRGARDALAFVGIVLAGALAISFWRNFAFAGRTEVVVLPVWVWAIARSAGERPRVRLAAMAMAGLGLAATVSVMVAPTRDVSVLLPAELEAQVRPGDRVFTGPPFYLAARLAHDRGLLAAEPRGIPAEIERHPGWARPHPFSEKDLEPLAHAAAQARPGERFFLLFGEPYRTPALDRTLASGGDRRGLARTRSGGVLMLWTPRAPPPPAPH
ncbi:MAG: hypothetical protein H7X85_07570 [Thermoanaerobaculia bacterium]|nr:hypothetical protein [Thermoanaerobaculia bacterium]